MENNTLSNTPQGGAKSKANASLFSGILSILFGFSISLIGLVFPLVTVVTGVIALSKGSADKSVSRNSWIGIGLVVIAILLWLVGVPGPIGALFDGLL
ncbi:hypothetical protein CL654_01310 [bacterium]|nr:hypothetical protein [bacterium]|tara:strand:- start:8005 stop:8298 length:294 start_codon:yes stop_codon:yes gene_type:complete